MSVERERWIKVVQCSRVVHVAGMTIYLLFIARSNSPKPNAKTFINEHLLRAYCSTKSLMVSIQLSSIPGFTGDPSRKFRSSALFQSVDYALDEYIQVA